MDLPHLSAGYVEELLQTVLRAARNRCAGQLEITAELLPDRRVVVQTRSLERETLDAMTMPLMKAVDYLNDLEGPPLADPATAVNAASPEGKLLFVPLFLSARELETLTRAGGAAWISHQLRRHDSLQEPGHAQEHVPPGSAQ